MVNRKGKSIIALILVVILCFAFVGCSKPAAPAASAQPADTSSSGTSASAGTTSASGVVRPEGVPADFPSKEIQWIYAFGPGSSMDAYFRILADKIQKMEGWKKGFLVTYKEGASGKIGWSAFATAKPDGYTLGFAPSAMLISAVSDGAPYAADKLSYIMNTMTDPGVIGVGSDSKYATLQDLIADAKNRPGQITFGVTSTIGQEGLTLINLEKAAGVKFKVVAFDSEASIFTAIVGKHLDAFCLNITDGATFYDEGKIKYLATGDEKRSTFLPDVPTYKECGYNVTQVNMRGIAGPAGIPEPIRQYLENCFVAAANDPEVQQKAKDMKIPVDTLNGNDMKAKFTQITADLTALWQSEPWQ